MSYPEQSAYQSNQLERILWGALIGAVLVVAAMWVIETFYLIKVDPVASNKIAVGMKTIAGAFKGY